MNPFMLGILLVILAGACEGLFSLGVTRTPKWRWENIWGLGSLIALVLVPWPVAYYTIPCLKEVFQNTSQVLLLTTFLFGVGWGLGGIFWGKGIAAVGMALGVSLLMGFINVFGSLGPMAITEPSKFSTFSGRMLLLAVFVMVVGIVFISIAGKLREKEQNTGTTVSNSNKPSTPFVVGLIFCLISGILSASVNFGFVFGNKLAQTTLDIGGASPISQNNAIWALVFTGNYLVNFLYALCLMIKNKNLGMIFKQGGATHWFWALFMGITWPLGIVLMGIAADKMGDYGKYAAFPMMLLCAVLFGNLSGALTGEWKGTSSKPKGVMLLGVLILFIAFALLAIANKPAN